MYSEMLGRYQPSLQTMDKSFDPYLKWLGIPPKDQPAHHYRLLGIEAFESDPEVISNAADQRMASGRMDPLPLASGAEVLVAVTQLTVSLQVNMTPTFPMMASKLARQLLFTMWPMTIATQRFTSGTTI